MKNLTNNFNNPVNISVHNLVHNFVNNGGHFVAPFMPVLGNLFGMHNFGRNVFGLNLRGLVGNDSYRDRKRE